MHLYVTGLNDLGASAVVNAVALDSTALETQPTRTDLWKWDGTIPKSTLPVMDVGCLTGEIFWRVLHWPAGWTHGMHRSQTVDIHTVLFGSVEMVLEDSTVELTSSDCVIMTGVAHAWRAGELGCVLNTTNIGV
jgi:hypothetical protein